jgi:hypothetical protein
MYYPKSQIKPNLFTNGGEYILSTTKEEYKGYYYKTSTGQSYTGKNPSNPQSILLEPLIISDAPGLTQNLPNNSEPIVIPVAPSIQTSTLPDGTTSTIEFPVNLGLYNNYPKRNEFENRLLPQFNPTTPNPQEKTNGQFTRYFCKRNNELKYMEISLDTYTQLSIKDPQISWDLYTPASVVWQIQGDKNIVYASNQSSVSLVEKIQTWYGFSQYFRGDFLKYYLGS